jgi:hypothetical protein
VLRHSATPCWALRSRQIHFLIGYLTTLFHSLNIARKTEVQFHKEIKDYLETTVRTFGITQPRGISKFHLEI